MKSYKTYCIFIFFFLNTTLMQGQEIDIINIEKQIGNNNWSIVNDNVMGGISESNLSINDKNNLIFNGSVSLENNGGFASSRLSIKKGSLKKIKGFKIKFIGDGKTYKLRLDKKNIKKIINKYDHIIDASDNFETKFLLNDFCFKYKKFLISGAISKFDGHIFSFDFKNKKLPCLRCFFQENVPSNDLLNCEAEGILGTVASTVGSIQANEILKKILSIGSNLNGYILILSLLTLTFRKAKITKIKDCTCNK